MSNTFTVHPILGCLMEAMKFIKSNSWRPITDVQERFLETCLAKGMKDLESFDDGELKCKAGDKIEEINVWLAENGFPDLQLQPTEDPNAFAVASILHVFLQWLEEGTKTTITYDGQDYPAAKLDYKAIKFFSIEGRTEPIAYVPTKREGEYVLMTIDDGIKDALPKMMDIDEKIKTGRVYTLEQKGLIFPTVEYDEKVDISFLNGMESPDPDPSTPPWYIVEAIQQTRFKMNHIGAEVESAAAATLTLRGMVRTPEPMIIDKPFLMGIFRKELGLPYFLGHFTEENWKEVEIDFK